MRGGDWRTRSGALGATFRKTTGPDEIQQVADGAGPDQPPSFLAQTQKNRTAFMDGLRRVSEVTLHKLGLVHESCDEITGNLELEIKRFKAIEEHHEEVKAMVEQYMSSVQSLASTDALLEALTPDAAPMASTPSTSTSGSASGNKAPSLAQVGSASDSNLTYHREAGGPIPSPSALFARTFSYAMPNKGQAKPSLEEPVPPLIVEGSGLMMATLTLSFEELLTRPLKQAQAHAEALRKEIKHRQSLLLDYDHHKRRADPVTVTSSAEHKGPAALASTMAPPVSGSYDRAASALREASSGLKLHLQAFDQAYTQLITTITQGHAACTIFYHRACLSRVEGTSLDQGLRQVLEATADALHPEVARYLSWMKSMAFVLEQGLSPKELGGCVPPFDSLVTNLTEALRPRPGQFFGRRLSVFGDEVPGVLAACTKYLDTHGMYTEGLFRVPGNVETVSALKAMFDQQGPGEGCQDLLLSLHTKPIGEGEGGEGGEEQEGADDGRALISVHDVATLYKLFLRELPSPLLPPACVRQLLDGRELPRDEFVSLVKECVGTQFSPCQARTLRVVLALLYRLDLCSEYNRMSAKNLGVCFAPTLLRGEAGAELGLSDIQGAIVVVGRLIETAVDVFVLDLWDDYPVKTDEGGEAATMPRLSQRVPTQVVEGLAQAVKEAEAARDAQAAMEGDEGQAGEAIVEGEEEQEEGAGADAASEEQVVEEGEGEEEGGDFDEVEVST